MRSAVWPMWFSWRLQLGTSHATSRTEKGSLGPWEAEAVLLVRQRLEVGIDGTCPLVSTGAAETQLLKIVSMAGKKGCCALGCLEGSTTAGSSRCRIGAASHHDRSVVVRFVVVPLPFLVPFLKGQRQARDGWPLYYEWHEKPET